MHPVKARIGQGGLLVIPAGYRRALGIRIGDTVVLSLDDDGLRVHAIDGAIRRAQEVVSQYVSPDRSLADELIAERRAESERA